MSDFEKAKKAWLAMREDVLHQCYGVAEDVAVLDKHFGVENNNHG